MAMLPQKIPEDTKSRSHRQLDPAECFDLWLELGSLGKVANHYKGQGIVNRRTGLPITIFGIRLAAYRWMFNHMPEAYERCVKAGSDLDWEQFRMFVLYKYVGHSVNGNASAEQWLKDNDFYDPTGELGYREIYEYKFGRIHPD